MNLVPKDIENPARRSGYDYVQVAHFPTADGSPPRLYYQAIKRVKPGMGSGTKWTGPGRATAEEAAQDYCQFMNTGGVATPATLKTAGHKGRRSNVTDAEEQAALGVLRDKRAQRKKGAKGYVYCISDGTAVKIGYSLKPEARVAELQTGNPRRLTLLATMQGGLADEKALHVKYLRLNILQEWFRPTSKLLSEFGLTKEAMNA